MKGQHSMLTRAAGRKEVAESSSEGDGNDGCRCDDDRGGEAVVVSSSSPTLALPLDRW